MYVEFNSEIIGSEDSDFIPILISDKIRGKERSK